MKATVDVLDHELIALARAAEDAGDYARAIVLNDARAAVAELIEAADKAKRAYWLARNSAAGLTNYCEESASTRHCERELAEAERIYRESGFDAALALEGIIQRAYEWNE